MRTITTLFFVLGALTTVSVVKAEDWPGEAGKSDNVKSWPGRDFESAKSAGMPLCIYFFDPEIRTNPRARLIEGKGALGNAEVRAKLPKFLCLKIRTDGTDYAGWPATLRNAAENSATLVLMSSDLRSVISYDRSFQNHELTPELVMGGMARILQYEEKQKGTSPAAARKPDTPEKEKKVTQANDTSTAKVPGLPTTEAAPVPKQARKKAPNPADE